MKESLLESREEFWFYFCWPFASVCVCYRSPVMVGGVGESMQTGFE